VQGIAAQEFPLHVQTPEGDETYAVVPASEAVHLGRELGVATESATV
jgi:hypothetical protein